MKILLSTLVLFLATNSFAKAVIKFPILFDLGNKIVGVSYFKKDLNAAKISIPEFVYIESTKDLKKIDAIMSQIEDANLQYKNSKGKMVAAESIYYGTVSSYQGIGIKNPLCYLKSKDVPALKGAEEATDLLLSLTDSVLTDQYQAIAIRFFGESHFRNIDNSDDSDNQEGLDNYKKTVLKKGDVQIINVTDDDGSNDSEDILSLCK